MALLALLFDRADQRVLHRVDDLPVDQCQCVHELEPFAQSLFTDPNNQQLTIVH